MSDVPVFHLGMTRSASTFLQLEVFPNLAKREYLKRFRISPLGYSHLSQMDQSIVKRFSDLAGRPVLLSQETIMCTKRVYTGKFLWDDNIVMANLKELYGEDCKILIIIRRQDTIIESMIRYKQRFLSDANMFLVDFPVKRSMYGTLKFESLFDKLISSYNYYRSIVPLLPLFGKDQIHIIPYEQLVSDKEGFLFSSWRLFEDLTRFARTNLPRRNTSSHKYANLPNGYIRMGHLARKINNLTGYRLEKFLPAQSSALPAHQAAEIRQAFAEDNRRLDQLFDLGLSSYGYY